MDSSTFWDFIVTFLQAMKEWPLASLALAGAVALIAIPIVMITKRVLDQHMPTVDTRIVELSRENGVLQEQIAQWRESANKAMAGERALIEQAEELHRQLAAASKQRASDPAHEIESVLKMGELGGTVQALRDLLDQKSRELREQNALTEAALASQRALADQVNDSEKNLSKCRADLEKIRVEHAVAVKKAARVEELEEQYATPRVGTAEEIMKLLEFIDFGVNSDPSVSYPSNLNLEFFVNYNARISIGFFRPIRGKRDYYYVTLHVAEEFRRLLTQLYTEALWETTVLTEERLVRVQLPGGVEGHLLIEYFEELLRRCHEFIPGDNPPLKFKIEWY